jgi:hypothetical protein
LGGIVVKPKAWRNSEKTIKIRVKLVIKTNAAGKKLSEVSAMIVSTGTAYDVPAAPDFAVTSGKV